MQAKRVRCVCYVMNLVDYQNYACCHLHGFLSAMLRLRTFCLASASSNLPLPCLALTWFSATSPRLSLINSASVSVSVSWKLPCLAYIPNPNPNLTLNPNSNIVSSTLSTDVGNHAFGHVQSAGHLLMRPFLTLHWCYVPTYCIVICNKKLVTD